MVSRDPFPRPRVQAWLEARLDEVREAGRGQLLSVRGRRQAGKSTAVEWFAEGSGLPYVHVTGLFRVTLGGQLEAAAVAMQSSRKPLPIALTEPAGSWLEWLSRLALAAAEGPIIVILDEFPWLAAGEPAELEGVLQMLWDRVLEKLPVLMILIGSDMAMMERLADHDRPLYGRVRELIVPALNPAEIAAALPSATAIEVFDAYLVTGGYPRLVADLGRRGVSVPAWVRDSFADDLSPLVATGRLSLDAEFPDRAAAYRVLSTIGSGELAQLGLGEIAGTVGGSGTATKTAETAALRALTSLIDEKRLVEREYPAWSTSNRLRRYRITDPYLRFWFRYVERNIGAIGRGRGDIAVAGFERDWSAWRGRAIEPIVRSALDRLAAWDERLTGIETVLPWWTRDGQVEVDVVGASRDRTVILGTIKWRQTGEITAREIASLAATRVRVPRAAEASLAAISPHGGTPASADLAFSASDLLAAWTPPREFGS